MRLSGIDPFDEPVDEPRPDLVLADLVLDPVLEIGVVVDLDDDDRAVGLLDVDAIEARADRAGRLERGVDDARRGVGDGDCLRSALAGAVRPVLDDLPVAARHLILAHEQRLAVEHSDPPVELGRHELLGQQEVGVLEQFIR